MHTNTHPRANRTRFSTLLDAQQRGGAAAAAAASVCASRALLVRPGKRRSQALSARLDAVKQRILNLA